MTEVFNNPGFYVSYAVVQAIVVLLLIRLVDPYGREIGGEEDVAWSGCPAEMLVSGSTTTVAGVEWVALDDDDRATKTQARSRPARRGTSRRRRLG